jgi:hypothetical protein
MQFKGWMWQLEWFPFLEFHDRISGSSVATAVATGLSSLISCDKLAHSGSGKEWVVK